MNDFSHQATRLEAIGGRYDKWLLGTALALAGDKDVKLTLDVQRPNGPLATLEARVLAPLAALQERFGPQGAFVEAGSR